MVNSITTAVRLLFLTLDFFLFSAACFGSQAVNLELFSIASVSDTRHLSASLSAQDNSVLRWLDWIFWGGYVPNLSINYVMSKDKEKRFPQLYYIKMKISYDLSFIAIGVAMAT